MQQSAWSAANGSHPFMPLRDAGAGAVGIVHASRCMGFGARHTFRKL